MRVGFRQIVKAACDNPRAGHPEWRALKNACTTLAAAAWPDHFALYGALYWCARLATAVPHAADPPRAWSEACDYARVALRPTYSEPMRELEMALHQRRVP